MGFGHPTHLATLCAKHFLHGSLLTSFLWAVLLLFFLVDYTHLLNLSLAGPFPFPQSQVVTTFLPSYISFNQNTSAILYLFSFYLYIKIYSKAQLFRKKKKATSVVTKGSFISPSTDDLWQLYLQHILRYLVLDCPFHFLPLIFVPQVILTYLREKLHYFLGCMTQY